MTNQREPTQEQAAKWQWGDELLERKLPSPEEQAVADAEHSLRMVAAGLQLEKADNRPERGGLGPCLIATKTL
jgi:hypothetical protein